MKKLLFLILTATLLFPNFSVSKISAATVNKVKMQTTIPANFGTNKKYDLYLYAYNSSGKQTEKKKIMTQGLSGITYNGNLGFSGSGKVGVQICVNTIQNPKNYDNCTSVSNLISVNSSTLSSNKKMFKVTLKAGSSKPSFSIE